MDDSKINSIRFKCICFIFLFVNFQQDAEAQKSDLGIWLNYNSQLRFSEHVGLQIDYQFRNYEFINDFEQSIIRAAAFYNFTKDKVQISVGAAYANTSRYVGDSEIKNNFSERRFHQQVLLLNRWGRVHINHRYRIEERFFSNENRIRFRYNLNIQVPINKKEIEKGALYLSMTDEIFIHNKTPRFDRNRVIAEVGYALSPTLRIESGVLLQMYEKNERAQIRFSILQIINIRKHD